MTARGKTLQSQGLSRLRAARNVPRKAEPRPTAKRKAEMGGWRVRWLRVLQLRDLLNSRYAARQCKTLPWDRTIHDAATAESLGQPASLELLEESMVEVVLRS